MQTVASTNVYIHTNNDEQDRIMIDPAYKMERMKEAHEKIYAFQEAYRLVEQQMKDRSYAMKIPFSKDLYENWYNIEKSILKLDRIFNKVEKFDARAMTDTLNHERREKRMLQRKNERWANNYTYFFGNLTEEEQMYRDYFSTDMENDPENDHFEDEMDLRQIAETGELNPNLYDFQDYT